VVGDLAEARQETRVAQGRIRPATLLQLSPRSPYLSQAGVAAADAHEVIAVALDPLGRSPIRLNLGGKNTPLE
jgi:hypothetical protein